MGKISILAVALSISSVASAKDIPVYVYWSGVPPTQVFISMPTGAQPLIQNGPVFHGTIPVPDGKPLRRTIMVEYGDYNQPFDLEVVPVTPPIQIPIRYKPQHSCTSGKVKEADQTSDNLVDAINRAVYARELLELPEREACLPQLRFMALRAELKQLRTMQTYSPVFLVNPQVEDEIRIAGRSHATEANFELASLKKQDSVSEVRQLIALKTEAESQGNYDFALQLNGYMSQRIESSKATASLYESQGVTKENLRSDAVFLTDPHSAVGTVAHYGERGN